MPPSPRSLLWPTMLMPKKLYFSEASKRNNREASTPGTHSSENETRGENAVYTPMLRVTVMMFRDIVESVTLLKEEAWKYKPQIPLCQPAAVRIKPEVERISPRFLPSPNAGGAVSCAVGGASGAGRPCSARWHC